MNEMFDVLDRWDVTVRSFDSREDAEEYVTLKKLEQLHIVERG